jgi:N-acetylglucosamine-6-sulfatase
MKKPFFAVIYVVLLFMLQVFSEVRLDVKKMNGVKSRNVVFILSDDHRYDAMGFLGHSIAKTPHMDAMADEGVHFRNALVTTSLCSPSRASILTGRYTFKHRVIDNQRLVPKGTIFFPQYLQKAGYKTAFVGKWHMGSESDEPRPGFDHWVSFKGQGFYVPPHENYRINVDGKRVPQTGYITPMLTQYALDFLDRQKESDEPFFLYLSHKAVHGPFTPEDQYRQSLSTEKFRLPESSVYQSHNKNNRPRWVLDQRNSWHGMDFPLHHDQSIADIYQNYCESLRSVDDSLGAVKEKLKEMGIYEDTLLIYMGDNGFLFGEHGLFDKRVAYEASMKVPLLMQCPDLFKGQQVVNQMVGNLDIAPTILHAMGLQKPEHMDGMSFLNLVQQPSMKWRKDFLYVYYWEQNYPMTPTTFALREDRYKFIHYYGIYDTDELYDLENDPEERYNLVYEPKHHKIHRRMKEELFKRMEELGGMNIPMNSPKGQRKLERLRSKQGEQAAAFPQAFMVDEGKKEKLGSK